MGKRYKARKEQSPIPSTDGNEPRSRTVVVGYVRVSTDEQALEGVSLAAQRAAIEAYCAMRGLVLTEVVKDAGVSAGKPLARRAGGAEVLELVRGGAVAGVVAVRLDRLFRDCVDCLGVVRGWDERGVALHLIDLGGQTLDTGSAMGRFFLTVMAAAGELERNLVGERTRAGMLHARERQGATLGGEALGWRRTGDVDEHGRRMVVADEEEQRTEQLIADMHAAGAGLSLRAIAGALRREGRTTKRGGRWHASTVRAVLKRWQSHERETI